MGNRAFVTPTSVFNQTSSTPASQQINVQYHAGSVDHGQAFTSTRATHGSLNQTANIAHMGQWVQGHDSPLDSQVTFPSSHEQQPQLGMHRNESPSRPKSLDFVLENPSNPQNSTNVKSQERGIQNKRKQRPSQENERERDERRNRQKTMAAMGGACLACYRRTKCRCDPSSICDSCLRKGWVCVRKLKSLSLHSLEFEMGTFTNVDRIIRELNCPLQAWEPEIVLEFRCAEPQSFFTVALDTTLVSDFQGFANFPASWGESLLEMIPMPQFPNFPVLESSWFIQSSALMLRQFASIIGITRAQLYAIPGHLFAWRVTLAFILAYLKNSLVEESQRFERALKQLLWGDRKMQIPHEVWLAVGTYYNVLRGLSNFEFPSLITDIFSDIKGVLPEVLRATEHIVEITYNEKFGEPSPPPNKDCTNRRQRTWSTFDWQVPVPPTLESLDVAIYFDSDTPTALARQFSAFDMSPIVVSELLSPGFLRGNSQSIGFERIPFRNWNSSALSLAQLPKHEKSSGAGPDSPGEMERASLDTFDQETEVSDGEDSTLVVRSDVDAEEDLLIQPIIAPSLNSFQDKISDIINANHAERKKNLHGELNEADPISDLDSYDF